jgi:hypothetical protein
MTHIGISSKTSAESLRNRRIKIWKRIEENKRIINNYVDWPMVDRGLGAEAKRRAP